ncbi:50S ribosomal protein L9 [Martelella endophytica]|uniref:Large ribosomal subunit protein bL9 n=1 Tax=Martelella endophytica TaxID=1486262 RepID=A0A0D5LS71_MAREN|nr:50S ribosomal protein L9 [Martelella endophytica]AJY46627.1 50S ribosomal protein L9 [Martelella endophytica]
MEVILLERIAKLGQMGQTVKVRDGYARNYLLPAGKALRANAANKARFEAERSVLEARNLERKNEAQEVADVLAGKSFIAVRAAGETGQLYGSVAARDVIEILAAEGFNISRNQVVLNAPIKTVGVHEVEIHLHAEVEITIELNVARTTEEAERQAKGEDLTSAEAIYGVDEDALRPEDFFNPDADYDIEDEQEEASAEGEEAGEEEDDK